MANSVEIKTGQVTMKNGASIQAENWTQGEAEFRGTAYVTGDAAFDDSLVGGSAGGNEVFLVGGEMSLAHDTVFESIDVTAGSVAFDDPRGEGIAAGAYLQGDVAKLDVTGSVTTTMDAVVFGNPARTNAEFSVGTLDVRGGTFQADVPTTVDADDTVTVAAGATLEMSNVVQRGSMSIAGTLALTGGATIEHDIVTTGGEAGFMFGDGSLVELVDGATIGGDHVFIANLGLIEGDGRLIGTVSNGGMIRTDAYVNVVGDYTQADDATLIIVANGDRHGQLGVSGDAHLGGSLELELPAGGTLPTESYNAVVAGGAVDGRFDTVEGLDHCATVEYDTQFVKVVPQPCVVIAAGQAQEDAGHIDFAVTLSKPSSEPVVVNYGLIPGTADITDYVDEPGLSLTIPSGETAATISVGLVDDEDEEQDETFTLTYTVEGGAAEAAEATGTIVDDDVKLHYGMQTIPVPGGMRWISALGTEYVLGTVMADADTAEGWVYRVSKDAFGPTRGNFMGQGLNSRDQAVGNCGSTACLRDHLVDTPLNQPSGTAGSAEPMAISDTGEIVGYISHWGPGLSYRPARWADASAAYEEFTALGASQEIAVDVNNHGVIVGNSTFADGSSRGWVRNPDGSVVDIGTMFDLPQVKVVGISDDGVVAGFVSDGKLWSHTFYGFTWTAEHGMISLGAQSLVMDIARNGDMTGHIGARSYLWRARDGKAIDLNKALALDPAEDLILTSGVLINDQGTIVSLAAYRGYEVVLALVPDGAGCIVCLDGHLYEHEFPTGSLIDAGSSIVEGNPTELFADVTNNDGVARTVTVSFVGADGQPLDDARTMTLAAKPTQHTYIPFDTEGLAWKDGTDAGPVELAIEMRDVSGNVVDSESFETRVIPRPIVNVHGMNRDASTWAGYPAFVSNAHTGWQAFAVDTMNTKPWTPNTIAQNAALLATYVTKIQTEQNAWQVDLVAHSMGGLRTAVHA